jgi:hypothetical protein
MSDLVASTRPYRAGAERSYLLRIRVERDGARYLVQDLKTGERQEFDSEVQLRRFIIERGGTGLR